MGRRTPKPSGRLNRGPWTGSEIRRRLEAVGWHVHRHDGSSHVRMRHPDRPGKSIGVDTNWTSIKPGHDGFRAACETSGYTKRELIAILNG